MCGEAGAVEIPLLGIAGAAWRGCAATIINERVLGCDKKQTDDRDCQSRRSATHAFSSFSTYAFVSLKARQLTLRSRVLASLASRSRSCFFPLGE